MRHHRFTVLFVVVLMTFGCRRFREDLDYDHAVEYSWLEPDLSGEFALFQGVHWNSAISQSLRPVIVDKTLVGNRSVLDLYSGPGVIAVTCGVENAKSVLSLADSDLDLACARYNVGSHELDTLVEVRQVNQMASPMLPASQKFDVILATLTTDAEVTLARRIELVLACFQGNLELSGRAIVVCEDEETAVTFKSACEQANLTLDSSEFTGALLPVFELNRPAP